MDPIVKDTPNLSIIVLASNRKDDVRELFSKLREQTYKFMELTLIDTGSTDGTFQMIKLV